MKHFPARHVHAQIGAHLADEITRGSRKQLCASVAHAVFAAVIGLIAGLIAGAGYLADLPAWLR